MLPDPSTIVPLDAEEFLAAHRYAGMVAENEFLEEVPAIGKPFIRTPDGMLGFSNNFANRFALALVRYFRSQPDKFRTFMWRFSALLHVLQLDEMKPYQRGTGDELEMHHAVFEVAATEKLVDGYKFEPKSFFQKVREVAERMETKEANALKRSRGGNKRSPNKRRTDIGDN